MINITKDLESKIKSTIEELGFFLYYIEQIKIGNQKHVIIYINKENYDPTISLDDCVEVTHKINAYIDDYIDEQYTLEISSSGINRRLYTKKHLEESKGHKIKLQLKNKVEGFVDKKVEGVLDEMSDEKIWINGHEIMIKSIKKAFYVGGNND